VLLCVVAGVGLIAKRLLCLMPVLRAMALFAACFHVDVIGATGDVIMRRRSGVAAAGMPRDGLFNACRRRVRWRLG